MTKTSSTNNPRNATPIDDHLSKLPPDQRQALQSLREVILSVMPDAEEVISSSCYRGWRKAPLQGRE